MSGKTSFFFRKGQKGQEGSGFDGLFELKQTIRGDEWNLSLRCLFGDLYLIVFFIREVSFGVELHWFNQKTLSVPKTFADLFI